MSKPPRPFIQSILSAEILAIAALALLVGAYNVEGGYGDDVVRAALRLGLCILSATCLVCAVWLTRARA